jgi:hypothetical protein
LLSIDLLINIKGDVYILKTFIFIILILLLSVGYLSENSNNKTIQSHHGIDNQLYIEKEVEIGGKIEKQVVDEGGYLIIENNKAIDYVIDRNKYVHMDDYTESLIKDMKLNRYNKRDLMSRCDKEKDIHGYFVIKNGKAIEYFITSDKVGLLREAITRNLKINRYNLAKEIGDKGVKIKDEDGYYIAVDEFEVDYIFNNPETDIDFLGWEDINREAKMIKVHAKGYAEAMSRALEIKKDKFDGILSSIGVDENKLNKQVESAINEANSMQDKANEVNWVKCIVVYIEPA